MILLDFSSIAMSAMFPRIEEFDEDRNLIRHTMINIIRKYNADYRDDFGETIVCMDAANSWRREYFKPYKANRRKNRNNSIHDWDGIFKMINQVRDDIIQHSPFKCIWVDTCEADDCIGTIVEKTSGPEDCEPEPILIVSPDGDFKQLQKYPNVKQWSNIQKKWVKSDNPEDELFEKICKGDTGDGVPNVLSEDEVLITEGARQTPVTKKQMTMLKGDPLQWPLQVQRRFIRNKTLIDLAETPELKKEEIMKQYNGESFGSIQSWMSYLMKHQMKLHLESLTDFEVRK